MDDLRYDDEMNWLIEDGLNSPACPYCDEIVTKSGTHYAGYMLHNKCYTKFMEELDDYSNVTETA